MIALGFLAYAVTLFLGAKWVAHHLASGWVAKLLTMALIAAGVWPWRHWLGPRVARVLDWIGRAVLTVAYFIVLLPFAAFVAVTGRRFRSLRGPSWATRRPSATTVEAAGAEW